MNANAPLVKQRIMLAPSSRSSWTMALIAMAAIGLVAAAITYYAATHGGVRWTTPPTSFSWNLPRWFIVSVVIFCAATLSSIVGFAFSVIAGAAMLHLIPDNVEAVQTMMVASIGIQAYSVAGMARSIQWRRSAPFVIGGLIALPAGIALLLTLSLHTYSIAMGSALVAYGLYLLVRRPTTGSYTGARPVADAIIGAMGGVTGALAASPGALVAIWCAKRGWNKIEQRAVFQPYILIMQLAGVATLAWLAPGHRLDPAMVGYALPALGGAVIGLRVFRTLTDAQFQRLIHVALIASGGALLFK